MQYAFVTNSGAIARYGAFDTAPPQPAQNKGRWLPATPPAYEPSTHFPPIAIEPVQPAAQAVSYYDPVAIPPIPLATLRAALIAQIDADTDALYRAVQGERGPEYALAEYEATEFKDAGYVGPVPGSVSSWANAKNWGTTQACDDILATATAWRTAQAALRAARLSCKELARTTTDVPSVREDWLELFGAVKTALGVA